MTDAPSPVMDPGRPAREFVAAAAQAARPNDDWIRALAAGSQGTSGAAQPSAAPQGASATPTPQGAPVQPAGPPAAPPAAAASTASPVAAPATPASAAPRSPDTPIGLAIDNASRSDAEGFFGRLVDAVHTGAAQSLRDLAESARAVAGGPVAGESGAAPTFEQPLRWGDLLHPETALTKAVYQVAHGAPVLAGGLIGAAAGGAMTSETGPGAALGAAAGGALGAGAVSAAESLGPYYASALRQPGATPQTAFAAALKRAGQDGAFTAAGWALFGLKPFSGAVQNLLFQAFGVQPAVSVAQSAVQNVEGGRPVTQDLARGVPGAVVETALPAAAHGLLGAVHAGAAPAEGVVAVEGAAASGAAEGAPDAGTPAPTAVPVMGAPAAAAPKVSGLETLNPADIKVDADRFQFKAGGDEAGVTDRLQGVKSWDPRLAGTVMVWRDENGQDWIADGHQRLGLAQRLAADGQNVAGINAFVLDSADGITAEQARAIAAAKNIAEGTGTSIDAAKVIRGAQQAGAPLPELPPRSVLVRDGQALAKLAPDAFGMAVNEVVPPQQAAIVGRLVSDGAQQTEAMRLLATLKPENMRQAESVVRDMLSSGTEPGVQHSLFGAEDFASSIVLERAKILDEATKQLARDKRTFGVLVDRADDISSAGNQLAGDANQQRLTTDEHATQLLQTLGTTRGPVSDELSGIARDFKAGRINRADAGRRFLRVVRRAIEEGVATGAAGGGTGPGDTAGEAGGRGFAVKSAAEVDAGWRPVQPGETVPADARTRFNLETGQTEAFDGNRTSNAPGAVPGAAESAGASSEAPDLEGASAHPAGTEDLFGPETASEPHAPPPGLSINGDPLDKLQSSPELQDAARRFLNGESESSPVQASLEALTRSPDIDAEVRRLATFLPRDGVKPDETLRLAAYTLQMDVTEAAAALRGRLPTDEQIGAFAMAMNSAAQELHGAAQQAVRSGETADWTKAIRGAVLLQRLLGEWTQAGTEQGRAFRARQLAWDARADITRQVQDVLNYVGRENVEEVVRKVAALDDPRKVAPFMRTLRWMRGREGLLYAWYNLLLSNPATFVKKGISDGAMAAFNLSARYAAEKSSDSVAPGEAGALLAGYLGSTSDAFRAAWKAMKAGHSLFAGEYTMLDGLSTNARLSLLAAGMEPGPDEGPTLRGWQFLRTLLPTSLISGMDDFAKVMTYRAELNAAAWRKAWQEGVTGQAQIDRQAELLDVVPPELHEMAMEAALRNTFQEPLQGLSQHMRDIADWTLRLHGTGIELPVGRMLLPFVRTPANIIRTAANWTPLPLAFEGTQVRADLAAGGARRALRLAQTGLGTSIAMLGAGLAWSGQMTGNGPAQPELRRAWENAGYRPYSIKIGGNWYGYRKIEPIGVLLGAIADTADLVRYANEEDALHAVSSLVFGVGNAILSASYLDGISGFVDALNNPETEAPRYLTGQVTSMFIPQGVAAVERATDQWSRAHYGFLDTIQSKIPGAAEGLPPFRDVWGDPIPQREAWLPGLTGSGAARLLSPFSFAPANDADPIKKWIWSHRADFPNFDNGRLGFYSFSPTQSFLDDNGDAAHVRLSAQQLDRLKELAGDGLKDPATGLGLKDYLNTLVRGDNPDRAAQAMWNRSTDSARAIMVHRAFDRMRAAAKKVLLQQDPDLQEKVMAQWGLRRQQLTGASAAPSAYAPSGAGAGAHGALRMPEMEGVH